MELEFGYNSEEESVFHSFIQENDKTIVQKVSKAFKTKQHPKRLHKEVKDILKRVSFDPISHSVLLRL